MHIFSFRMFLKEENISLKSIQSAETNKFKSFVNKKFQKHAKIWKKSVLSVPEISPDAPIRIESESK